MIYDLPNEEQLFVEGEMMHKAENKFFIEQRMIRPNKDTIFMHQQIYNGKIGQDSTMQGKKLLQGANLELLKYKIAICTRNELQKLAIQNEPG
ncbi:MAG: hypothetical protein HC831_19655 [Chloroflexia bacterium]|nr:hypothetical protein [Chloroflexia bacterium]